jgi:hypothetical protein
MTEEIDNDIININEILNKYNEEQLKYIFYNIFYIDIYQDKMKIHKIDIFLEQNFKKIISRFIKGD